MDIERIATELAALSPDDREQVMQRLKVIGVRSRATGNRLRRDGPTFIWADLIGENLYDTYGVAVAVVKNVKLVTVDKEDHQLKPFKHAHRLQVGDTAIEIFSYAITRSET